MMCSVEECERNDWTFGAKGLCNNVTGLCDCPPGYSGSDPFVKFNDCHLHIQTYENVFAFTSILSMVSLPLMFGALYLIVRNISEIRDDSITSLHSTIKGSFSSAHLSEGEGIFNHRMDSRDLLNKRAVASSLIRQNRLGVITIVQFTFFFISLMPVQLMLATSNGDLDYPVPRLIIVMFSMGWIGLWSGCWTFVYIYWGTFPDMLGLSKILHIKSYLISHPDETFKAACAACLITNFGYFAGAIARVAQPSRMTEFSGGIRFFPVWTLLSLIALTLFFIPMCSLIRKILESALLTPNSTSDSNIARVESAIRILTSGRAHMLVLAGTQIPLLFFFSLPIGLRYFHMYIASTVIAVEISILRATLVVATGNLVGSRARTNFSHVLREAARKTSRLTSTVGGRFMKTNQRI